MSSRRKRRRTEIQRHNERYDGSEHEEITRTNKEKIAAIYEILGIDANPLEMPHDGFSQESLNNTGGRSFRRGKRIMYQLIDSICDVVSPSNPQFKEDIVGRDTTERKDEDTKDLITNVTDLIFQGSQYTKQVVKAILAKSFRFNYIKNLLAKRAEEFTNQSGSSSAVEKKITIGRVQFSSLQKSFDILLSGRDIPKNKRRFRISQAQVSTVIQFIQGSLCLKAGVVRDVKYDGYLFKDMPVYERGGKSIRALNKSYNDTFDKDKRVGQHLFFDLMKFMTRRGESKAGLSTYYIQLRYSGSVFIRMVKRVVEFEFTNADEKKEVKERSSNLLKEWEEVQMFVMWEYTNRHLKESSSDPAHCYTYALGGKCTHHNHRKKSCSKCNSCFDFFDKNAKQFLDYASQHLLNDNYSKEVKSMYRALPIFTYSIKHYMAHRLRAKVQFNAIEKIKKSLYYDPTRLYIGIDHKQKILQMRFREGQVDYYGRKGMSDLGAMIDQWDERKIKAKSDNGKTVEIEVGGFEHSFIDFVFKNYTGQDHTQVAAAIEQLVSHVHQKYPEVREIILQSDNATCFSSQEHIPFIHHLNQESKTNKMPIISRWIFTEAQTGRGKLDTHFSYLNTVFKSFIEDGNDILTEEHILDALAFNGGVAGTTGILLDCTNLRGDTISKKFKTSKVKSRSTHEIRWYDSKVEVYESSDVTTPEVVKLPKLNLHTKNDLDVTVARSVVSEKPALFSKEVDVIESRSVTENLVIEVETAEDDETANIEKKTTLERNWSTLKRKRNYDENPLSATTKTGLTSSLVISENTTSRNDNEDDVVMSLNPERKRNFDESDSNSVCCRAETVNTADNVMSSKASVVRDALQSNGIMCSPSNNTANNQALVDMSKNLHAKWAKYPGNNPYKMQYDCIAKLKELYDIGKTSKKQKVTAERAHQILVDTIISDDWEQQLVVTVPKIKSFFQMTPARMRDAIKETKSPREDVG